MSVDDIGFGVLGDGGEGVFDPYALLQALRRKAISQGAEYRAGEVAAIEKDGAGRVSAAILADGSRIACGLLVNAAGPAASAVAAMAGIELPVLPIKALTFAFRCRADVPGCPVVLDQVQRMNFKPEGELFLVAGGGGVAQGRDDFEVDHDLFNNAWAQLAHRVAAFEAVKMVRGWAGHLEINTFDGNAILGRHPECDNFVFANGFSGHGVQHIPAAGRAIAELLTWGEYRTLDLSRFGYQRLIDNEPVAERVG